MVEPGTPLEVVTSVEVPLRLLVRPLPPGTTGPVPVVLGFHGYAMDAASLFPVLSRIAPEGFLLVGVEGPASTMVPGHELGAATPRGFHYGVSPRPEENRAIHRNAVEAALKVALEHGGDTSRVSLVGFSQPCSFNYRLALDPPGGRPFRAVVGLCGGIPGEWTETEPPATAASRATAVLHVSTRADRYFPLERVATFPPMLERRFGLVVHALHDGGHRIPGKAIGEAHAFLLSNGATAPAGMP